MRLAILTCVLLVAAVLPAGCGDEGGGERAGTEPAPPAATASPGPMPTATAPPAATDPLQGAGTAPATAPATSRRLALLTDVRAARHQGYDRVVLEFSRALPGHDVRYAQRPIQQDGSGDEVTVDGQHVVVVRMENALDADLETEGAPPTYVGPSRLRPATPVVAELVRAGGFEGVLTWAVGLRDRVDFRVSTLRSPHRLVLDFRNH